MNTAVALAWHDVTCPQGLDCRARALHAASDVVPQTILPAFLGRLEELAPTRAIAAGAAGTAGEGYRTEAASFRSTR